MVRRLGDCQAKSTFMRGADGGTVTSVSGVSLEEGEAEARACEASVRRSLARTWPFGYSTLDVYVRIPPPPRRHGEPRQAGIGLAAGGELPAGHAARSQPRETPRRRPEELSNHQG